MVEVRVGGLLNSKPTEASKLEQVGDEHAGPLGFRLHFAQVSRSTEGLRKHDVIFNFVRSFGVAAMHGVHRRQEDSNVKLGSPVLRVGSEC